MKNKYAVIVVDMLNDFVSGSIAHPRINHIIQPIKELCDRARAAGVPVIYANDSHTPEVDKEFAIWGPHAVEGTWGAEVIDELKPQKGDYVIPKKHYSGFFETSMERVLRELEVNTVIITRWQADCCCRHTSADAFFRGFKIIVPKETTDTLTDDAYLGALEYIKNIYGGKICSVKSLKF